MIFMKNVKLTNCIRKETSSNWTGEFKATVCLFIPSNIGLKQRIHSKNYSYHSRFLGILYVKRIFVRHASSPLILKPQTC